MSRRPRVLVASALPGKALERLKERAEVQVGLGGASLAALLPDVDGLICLLSNRVGEAELDAGKRLRIVANYAVGFDNVDLAAADARGVWVTNTPDVLTDATADLAFALLLAVARRVLEGDRLVREGGFRGWAPSLLLGADLRGKRLGIVGMGRIGRAVAARARPFGLETVYFSRSRLSAAAEKKLGARSMGLAELLRTSDFVSLHAPLTSETRHLIDARALARMKPTAILVNTARGPLVDEAALAEALHAGRIAGAGLDVYELEPKVHPRLLSAPNAVLLPHLGSAARGTRETMAELAVDNVLAVLSDRRPLTPINRPKLQVLTSRR